MVNKDKAGEDYWTSYWKNLPLPEPFHFDSGKINDYPNKILHNFFKKILTVQSNQKKRILEIGCGNSVFLPYFYKHYGYEIYGLDYSEYACAQSQRILDREKTPGKIIQGDAFNPPTDLTDYFDVVCSFGVVEHFEDTTGTLEAFSKFLRKGGILITSIPNLTGLTGHLQKMMNKQVYDVHVPLSKKDLERSIESAGLKLTESKYFLSVSIAVTLEGKEGTRINFYSLKKAFIKFLRYGIKIIWAIENKFKPIPAGRYFSGGVITAAIKK